MTRRDWPPALGVALGYALVALAFAWPLPLHLGTRLLGDPGGDTGVYVWNQWVFEHEAVAGANPLTTQQILALYTVTDVPDLMGRLYGYVENTGDRHRPIVTALRAGAIDELSRYLGEHILEVPKLIIDQRAARG